MNFNKLFRDARTHLRFRTSERGRVLKVGSISLTALLILSVIILMGIHKVDRTENIYASTEVRISDVESPTLLYKTDKPGLYKKAVALQTDVDLKVTGMVLRGTVTQTYSNETDGWLEAVYVFPLPENSAVDYMKLRIGDRIIEGQIKEKAQAKKIYETAKREGKKASLVEQERPNIFTTSVANIGPGEEVDVIIEYQQDLHYEDGKFSFRFPMVITPRFIPGTTQVDGFDGTGWGVNTADVPDAERITPPVEHPSAGKINPINIKVELNAGFPLRRVESLYHEIEKVKLAPVKYQINLINDTYADKDFVLEWEPEVGKEPNAALFTEEYKGENYIFLMVMPPNEVKAEDIRIPRETIFIIDTSGSMDGTSIQQARKALSYAVEQLQPEDKFNIIEFNDYTRKFSATSIEANPENIKSAKKYIENLNSGGGTVMLPALRAALEVQEESSRVRQVIFMTDGAVGNEAQLFSYIKYNLGRSRLFTIGIGSAPNSHFMTQSADFGKGTFTYIGSINEVEEKMKTLFSKLENPYLTEIQVQWNESGVEMYPDNIPDLYQGQPVLLSAKLQNNDAGKIQVTGKRGTKNWKIDLNLEGGAAKSGLAKLWARKKIQKLMQEYNTGNNQDMIREQVLDTALTYHLVSKFTSLVAVDVTPSRPVEEDLNTAAVPTNLPEGMNYEKVFGAQQLPQTGTASKLYMIIGFVMLLAAALLKTVFLRG
ncbi:MAG: marine proteobacterial sortase target protein [Acidobacteria bacterium]|nr:marine proteobacterial sortase target protein [Acidobacteriota bacterium]